MAGEGAVDGFTGRGEGRDGVLFEISHTDGGRRACLVSRAALESLDGGLSLPADAVFRLWRRWIEGAAIKKIGGVRPEAGPVRLDARDLRLS